MLRESLSPWVEESLEYMTRYSGVPYLWGGDDPIAGFDCSGLACEYLHSLGLLPQSVRTTADGLLRRYLSECPEHVWVRSAGADNHGKWTPEICKRGESESTPPPPGAQPPQRSGPLRGDLVFYVWDRAAGPGDRVQHVEIALNPWQTLGASGGGSGTVSEEEAVKGNAYVKVRPVRLEFAVALLSVTDLAFENPPGAS